MGTGFEKCVHYGIHQGMHHCWLLVCMTMLELKETQDNRIPLQAPLADPNRQLEVRQIQESQCGIGGDCCETVTVKVWPCREQAAHIEPKIETLSNTVYI